MSVRVRHIVRKELDVPGLGEKIRRARENDERSLTALAREVGISRNYWYQLESETVLGGMSLETLRKIESVLNVDFDVKLDD